MKIDVSLTLILQKESKIAGRVLFRGFFAA